MDFTSSFRSMHQREESEKAFEESDARGLGLLWGQGPTPAPISCVGTGGSHDQKHGPVTSGGKLLLP